MDTKGLRTWIEIDRSAIKHNYDVFRSLIPEKTKLCGVVKSNAYGHDFMQYAKELEKLGVDWIAVDSITEGVRLRKEGIVSPIFILGYTLPERIKEAVDNDISVTVSTFESLEDVSEVKGVKVHIKLDTGMSRQGFLENDKEKLFEVLKKKDINVEGVFTHFASAKNPTLPHSPKKQIEKFNVWKESFEKEGFDPIFHASATSGTLLFSEAHFDMVRIGIGIYGLWPSIEAKEFLDGKIELKPVLKWKTVI